jgi:hypothetical protein
MKGVSRLLTWSSINYLSAGFLILIGLFIVGYIVKIYDIETLGLFALINIFTVRNGFLSVFDFGVSQMITRGVSKSFLRAHESSRFIYEVRRMLGVTLISGLSLMLIGSVIALFLFQDSLFWLVIIYLLSIPSQFYNYLSARVLEGAQMILLARSLDLISGLSIASCLLFMGTNKYDFTFYLLALSIVSILLSFVNLLILNRLLGVPLSVKPRMKLLVTDAEANLFKTSLSASFYAHYPRFILMSISNEALGIYELAMRVPRFIKFSVSGFSSIIVPLLTPHAYDKTVVGRYLQLTYLYFFGAISLVVSGLYVFGEEFLVFWVGGSEYLLYFNFGLLWSLIAVALSLGGPFLIVKNIAYEFMFKVNSRIVLLSFFVTILLLPIFPTLSVYIGSLTGMLFIPFVMAGYFKFLDVRPSVALVVLVSSSFLFALTYTISSLISGY